MMARIDAFTEQEKARSSVHEPVEASYSIYEVEGKAYLQIDTYGSADRQIARKVSQSIQLGPEGIEALRKILSQLP